MKNVGTYCNGDPYLVNPVAGTGVNFTSITPASANSAGRQINGAMINFGEGGLGIFLFRHRVLTVSSRVFPRRGRSIMHRKTLIPERQHPP